MPVLAAHSARSDCFNDFHTGAQTEQRTKSWMTRWNINNEN